MAAAAFLLIILCALAFSVWQGYHDKDCQARRAYEAGEPNSGAIHVSVGLPKDRAAIHWRSKTRMRLFFSKKAKPSHPPCPICGSASTVVPIVYGLPAGVPWKVRRGEAVLGGCVIRSARFYCKACKSEFPKSEQDPRLEPPAEGWDLFGDLAGTPGAESSSESSDVTSGGLVHEPSTASQGSGEDEENDRWMETLFPEEAQSEAKPKPDNDCRVFAEVSLVRYIVNLYSDEPRGQDFGICIWSYLFCTEPRDSALLAFREQHKAEIERRALRLLEEDEPLRKVIVATLQVELGVCSGYGDMARFERILSGQVLNKYSREYILSTMQDYAELIQDWLATYSPGTHPKPSSRKMKRANQA